MLSIATLSSTDANFSQWLRERLHAASTGDPATEKSVRRILDGVRLKGDSAVLKYAREFDASVAQELSELEVPHQECVQALERLEPKHAEALRFAAERIRSFHQKQAEHMAKSWQYTDTSGALIGGTIIPLKSVGVYVPGGSAVYPSTVLMSAIPARIAGVQEIVMMTPGRQGVCHDMVLAAAQLAEVDKIYCIGGAQAIGALAYGTETISAVNKIVGPGNRYICAAKAIIRDLVGIDTIAGPSELLIIADRHANPKWVALDLMAQAEHDPDARTTLISTSSELLSEVTVQMAELLPDMSRSDTIRAALNTHGAMILASDIDEAILISDDIAPEHLSLMTSDNTSLLAKVHHAGGIFLGDMAAQVLGDYCAGPSHVLPTGGRARFDSGLNVSDFYRYSGVTGGDIRNTDMYSMSSILARAEGLDAHALAAEARLEATSKAGRAKPEKD
jgi:histidinol dehydrogenase